LVATVITVAFFNFSIISLCRPITRILVSERYKKRTQRYKAYTIKLGPFFEIRAVGSLLYVTVPESNLGMLIVMQANKRPVKPNLFSRPRHVG